RRLRLDDAPDWSDGHKSSRSWIPLVLDERVVLIAIQPALARLRRRGHRMLVGARVLARVAIGRRVATERAAARLARAQMHPPCANLHALVALIVLRMLDRGDAFQVFTTTVCHVNSFRARTGSTARGPRRPHRCFREMPSTLRTARPHDG